MSRWHGPAYRGAMRDLRKAKRADAEQRNALTRVTRTKRYRLYKARSNS